MESSSSPSAVAWNTETSWPKVTPPDHFPFPPPVLDADGATSNLLRPGTYWPNRYPSNYPPGSGLSRESSRDDLTSLEFDQVFEYEERFRVDRKKLELLMTGRFEIIKESAAEFFQKIGEETNTTIAWPSRLKVGAKSKKDPHIRIGGQEEGVLMAKSMVMEFLDTKLRRVTMKMDVSYTDHSHIIGKGGNTIRRVMSETGCHIHFPDSNRSNPNEKSNQVSIAGREMEGVEKARARVRELTPLIFTFDLPIISFLDTTPDPNTPYMRAIQDQYNVQLTFRQKQKNFHTTMAVVKGCEWEAARVKEATLLLLEYLCGTLNNTPTSTTPSMQTVSECPVSMNMEISPVHHSVVLGKNNINLKVIMQRTKTTILFPDAGDPNIPPIRKGSVTISGAIHNVYTARQQLLGSLPLVMMFDMADTVEPFFDSEVHKIAEDLDVSISVKPKHRQLNKSVLIKAQERNASGIYAARHKLLKLDDDEVLVVADVPESYKIQPLTAQMLSGLNVTNNSMVPNLSRSPLVMPPQLPFSVMNNAASPLLPTTPLFGSAPPLSPYTMPQTPWAGALSNAPFGNVLTPNHPYLQDYAWLVLNNITRLQQQQLLEQQLQRTKDESKNNNDGSWIDPNNNLLNDQNGVGHSPPIDGTSPRNSSPVRVDGNLTNNLSKLDLNSSGNDKNFQLPYPETEDNVMMSSSSGIGTSGTTGNNSRESSNGLATGPDDFGQIFLHKFSDRRAPGCEMKTRLLAAQKQFGNASALDYDQKRLMAAKAMAHNEPEAGQPRTPTTSWSGLGFSTSMPENVLKEKLTTEETAAANQDPFKLGDEAWFGNSSAFEALLKNSKMDRGLNNNQNSSTSNVILTADDLPTLLTKQGLAKYTDLFVRHEVDLQTFASLTEQDLREIGVQTFGARKKLLLLANKVKQMSNEEW